MTPEMARSRRLIILPVLATTICLAARAQDRSDFHVRVQAFVVAEEDSLGQAVKREFSRDLERIEGVLVVEKDPDYLVVIRVRRAEGGVSIAIMAAENLSGYVAQALTLGEGLNGEQRRNQAALLQALTPVPFIDVYGGKLERVPDICRELVTSLDRVVFDNERRFPRGGLARCDAPSKACDEVRMNFFGRIAAKRVIRQE